jgi:hypothetical protein
LRGQAKEELAAYQKNPDLNQPRSRGRRGTPPAIASGLLGGGHLGDDRRVEGRDRVGSGGQVEGVDGVGSDGRLERKTTRRE